MEWGSRGRQRGPLDSPAPSGVLARGRHQHPRRASLIAVGLSVAALATEAHADELDDFIRARDAYINGEYSRAVRELQELAGRVDTPRLAVVRPNARKFLAASLFADRHEAEARVVIGDLLRAEPRTRLEPGQFEVGFTRLFDDVVRSMEAELDRILVQRAQARRAEENARDARRALTLDLLGSEARVQVVPRWQTFIPFGIGQFANRQTGLGVLFLSLETTFLLGSVAAAVVDQAVRSPTQSDGVYEQGADDQRANVAFTMRVLNWTLLSAFVATTVIGIVQANGAYIPQRVIDRVPRPVPPALQGVQISAQPGAMGASLHFTL